MILFLNIRSVIFFPHKLMLTDMQFLIVTCLKLVIIYIISKTL